MEDADPAGEKEAEASTSSPKDGPGLGKKLAQPTTKPFSPKRDPSGPTATAPKGGSGAGSSRNVERPRQASPEAKAAAASNVPVSERKVKEANDFFSRFTAAPAPATQPAPLSKLGSALKTPALRAGLAAGASSVSSMSGGSKGSSKSAASSKSATSSRSAQADARILKIQENAAARKARLAEVRAKSKPVHLAKADSGGSSSTMTVQASAKAEAKSAAATTAEKQKEEKRKALAAQMRQKHFAEAGASKKKVTIAAPTIPSLPTSASASKLMQHTPKQQSAPSAAAKHPERRPTILSPMDTYEMSDREETDSDSSDYDSEDDKPRKKIPKWAQKQNLIPALERQFIDGPGRGDPDEIFPEVSTCNLELVFDQKKARYKKRTSSANWTKDKVTVAEKLVYKRKMGFKSKR